MFFRAIDKFFFQIKNFITIITFVLIGFSCLFFVYWLLFSANLKMPDIFNAFIWSIIDFFAQSFKNTPLYNEILPLLPVLTCGIFILLTYLANCLMVFLENNHRLFKNCVQNYKTNLEKTINTELHNDFINELKRTSYMLIKINIAVIKQESYLSTMSQDDINSSTLEDYIEKQIVDTIDSQYIEKKGVHNRSGYFLINNIEYSKDFLIELVSKSSKVISSQLRPKLEIDFYCVVELLNNLSEFPEKSDSMDKILDLKIKNKIAATPRVKVYFDNIFPNVYKFDTLGEYNLSQIPANTKNVMIYSMSRKR